jgi:DNA polymerase-3 subunit delta'
MTNSNSSTQPISIKYIDTHAFMWKRMQPMLDKKKIPQALLLIGPRHTGVLSFAYRFIATVLCHDELSRPCGVCFSCVNIQQGTHPDVYEITHELNSGSIKIEQVRELQQRVYQTPHSEYRFVLIHPVDQLNNASANALLKIIEEPPKQVVFILIAEQNTVSPTLLSRCQRHLFSTTETISNKSRRDYLQLAEYYPDTSARHQLYQERAQWVNALISLVERKADVCSTAMLWKEYPLEDFLWFFYLLTSSLVKSKLLDPQGVEQDINQLLKHLSARFKQPMHLYSQLDLILELIEKVQQNVPLNQMLVIETVLLSYFEASHVYTL